MLRNRGMSLVELLVVLGIFTFMLALGSIVSLGNFRSSDYRSDREMLIDILLYVRSKAQLHGCGTEECGLHVDEKSFTVFGGASYQNRDTKKDLSFRRISDASISGNTDILFLPGSGYIPAPARVSFGVRPNLTVEITETGNVTALLEP